MSASLVDKTGTRFLQCMEIWGGNRAIESGVSVPGIDAWIISRPHGGEAAGGDVHYVSLCGGHKIARFAVADVSGHGEAVGGLASALRGLMRRHINKVDQTRFVQSLNREFSSLAASGAFATALLATYFAPNDYLITCNAGHPRPLWYRAATGAWQFLDHEGAECLEEARNLPLGIIEPTNYHQFAVQLEKNDLVLIYTDALIEARDGHRRPLGESGLLDLVGRIDVGAAADVCRSLLAAVEAYRDGAPAEDDATILLLHHNAANPAPPSIGEVAKVVGKMLGLIKV